MRRTALCIVRDTFPFDNSAELIVGAVESGFMGVSQAFQVHDREPRQLNSLPDRFAIRHSLCIVKERFCPPDKLVREERIVRS